MSKKQPSVLLAANISASLKGRICGKSILVRCYNNMNQMLIDRGMKINYVCQNSESLDKKIDSADPVTRAYKDGCSTVVYIDAEERTGVKFYRTVRENERDNVVIVIINVFGPTPFTKREVDEHTEFWTFKELLVNPTRHVLVPEHRLLTDEEITELKESRKIMDHQWPVLLSSDMIARWYRFPKGGIVRIHRRGIAHEEGLYYRKVQ